MTDQRKEFPTPPRAPRPGFIWVHQPTTDRWSEHAVTYGKDGAMCISISTDGAEETMPISEHDPVVRGIVDAMAWQPSESGPSYLEVRNKSEATIRRLLQERDAEIERLRGAIERAKALAWSAPNECEQILSRALKSATDGPSTQEKD